MKTRRLVLLLPIVLAACVAPPAAVDPDRRPLEVLPAGTPLVEVEADLLATARDRFGEAALERALAAPIHLVVKRFAGMVPPPPPGAGADWRPPTPAALLYKQAGTWMAATPVGWRQVDPAVSDALDRVLASRSFLNEPSTVPACPDFGASQLLLKMPDRPRIVRSHQCTSESTRVVEEALRA